MSNYLDPSTWRQQTEGGIPFRLVDRGGVFTEEDATAEETFLIPADRLLDFVNEIVPSPVVFGDTIINRPGTGMLGFTSLRAASIKWKAHVDGIPIDPFDADAAAPDGTYKDVVEVTVSYDTSKTNDDESDDPKTFLEISGNAAGEFINTTAPAAKWKDTEDSEATDNKEAVVPVTLLMPSTEWTVRWPQIPNDYYLDILVPALRTSLGKVNSEPVDVLFNAPAETLFFIGFTYKEQLTWRDGLIGRPPIALSMKFLEKNILYNDVVRGHQDFWKPGIGWQRLLIDGENPTYQTANFNNIWSLS